ncbi:MAG: CPBP family intramembrane metalloprotease [Clostridia bacterium]|nr:CPBP family intramembrane metalloprotease [Clostridia bacterium]
MEDYSWTTADDGVSARSFFLQRETEKRSLKRQSIRAGLCVIAYVLLDLALFYLLICTRLLGLYQGNETARELMEMFFYLLCMFVPFAAAYALMRSEEKDTLTLFQKPVSRLAALTAIPVGFLVCSASNYVTNLVLSFLEGLGFSIGGGTYETPMTAVSLVFSLLTIGILPAFVEEFALRGVIMQPLRKHGDGFAIVMSAFVFALMHGNLSQFTFAFPVGIAIGYFVVTTGSIWVGAAIHLLNNTYSVVLNFLLDWRPTAADTFYNITNSVSIVLGVVCIAVYWKLCPNKNRLQKGSLALTSGEKASAYLFTFPMVIAVIILVIKTLRLIRYEGM